jgi:hypothetical protein
VGGGGKIEDEKKDAIFLIEYCLPSLDGEQSICKYLSRERKNLQRDGGLGNKK